MKLTLLLPILMFANILSANTSFASIQRQFFVRNGTLLLTVDLPNNPNSYNQPVSVKITDPATHQPVEVFNTYVEIVYWLPGNSNIQTTDDMDRCDEKIPGHYCSHLKLTGPGAWNLNVTYKEFRGNEEAQTFMFEVR